MAVSRCEELQELLTHSTSECTRLEQEIVCLKSNVDQLTEQHKSVTNDLSVCQHQLAGAQKLLQQKEKDVEVRCDIVAVSA